MGTGIAMDVPINYPSRGQSSSSGGPRFTTHYTRDAGDYSWAPLILGPGYELVNQSADSSCGLCKGTPWREDN